MKKIVFMLITSCIVGGSVIYAGWNPFKKSSWEKVGEGIKKGAETVGKGIKKGAETVGKGFVDTANQVAARTKACSEMTALAAEWAGKQAAYGIAKAGLEVANQSLKAAQKVAQGTLDAGKGATVVTSKLLSITADAIDKGINITRVYLSGRLTDFKKGEFPEFQVVGTAFGKDFNVKLQLDVNKPANMIKELVKKVF